MKQSSFSKPALIFILFLSLAYWAYLVLNSAPSIAMDATIYEKLGKIVSQQGWAQYLKNGPGREPFYPFLISLSMQLSALTGVAYLKIQIWLQILILLITQLLLFKILKELKISPFMTYACLIYFAISPALLNAALSLYSEIAAFPFILLIILASSRLYNTLKSGSLQSGVLSGLILGATFLVVTLTKTIFECITPLYFLFFGIVLAASLVKINKKLISRILISLLAGLMIYYTGLFGYKSLNQKYNGNFALTDHGAWALYGNTARRMQPLTPKQYLIALSYVPGEGVCHKLFTNDECDYWSYKKSDLLGPKKSAELTEQGVLKNELNSTLIKLSAKEVFKNPLQYGFFMILEGLKVFFWESTQISFVEYPQWLTQIYNLSLFKDLLRLFIFLITFLSFITCLNVLNGRKSRHPKLSETDDALKITLCSSLLLIILFVFIHTFFFVLTRYALPIASVYLITIAFALNHLFFKNNLKYGQNN